MSTQAVLAVGGFDGMHRGHRELAESSRRRADGLRTTASAVVINDCDAPVRLSSVEERIEGLLAYGMTSVHVLDFRARSGSVQTNVTTLATEIVERLQPAEVTMLSSVAGVTPRIGQAFDERGVHLSLVPRPTAGDEPLTSKRARDLLREGDVAGLGNLLDRSVDVAGLVIHGAALGRTIGFPTANVDVETGMTLPALGVYAAICRVDGVQHAAAVNIGVRPTLGDNGRVSVEAHLIDFDDDIYGRRLELALIDRIRAEQRFDGLDRLVQQLHRDVDQVRERCQSILTPSKPRDV